MTKQAVLPEVPAALVEEVLRDLSARFNKPKQNLHYRRMEIKRDCVGGLDQFQVYSQKGWVIGLDNAAKDVATLIAYYPKHFPPDEPLS